MGVSLGHIAQREIPAAIAFGDVESRGGRQQHRLGEPNRIAHRVRKTGFDIRQYRRGSEHPVRDDGGEAEQFRRDRVGVDRVVIAADGGIAADLRRGDPQDRGGRGSLGFFCGGGLGSPDKLVRC